jgi:hypothetical protein
MSSDDPSWLSIYAGDVDQNGNGEIYDVDFFITHEGYDEFDHY